jgi:hypothetical protein
MQTDGGGGTAATHLDEILVITRDYRAPLGRRNAMDGSRGSVVGVLNLLGCLAGGFAGAVAQAAIVAGGEQGSSSSRDGQPGDIAKARLVNLAKRERFQGCHGCWGGPLASRLELELGWPNLAPRSRLR